MLKWLWYLIYGKPIVCEHKYNIKIVHNNDSKNIIKYCNKCGMHEVIITKCDHVYELQSKYDLGFPYQFNLGEHKGWVENHRCIKCGDIKQVKIKGYNALETYQQNAKDNGNNIKRIFEW